MARLAVAVATISAVIAASVFTAGPASATQNYTILQCADGVIHKTVVTFGVDAAGNETMTSVTSIAGSCEHGPWITHYSTAVNPPTTDTPLTAEASLAIAPGE